MKSLLICLIILFIHLDLTAQSNWLRKKKTESLANELIIYHPLTGDKIQVANEDIDGEMNWFQAVRACNKMGQSWRLPTIEELKVIYSDIYLKGKGGNFTKTIYWSSSEIDNELAWIFLMENGQAFDIWITSRKGNSYYVRPVRNL